ncbi:MAG TPA: cupin domain-containing protein [Ilumatobacteraceae bacterium]|nr:cupin domain-containing protein [Ilumatobacteraceae bacterium]
MTQLWALTDGGNDWGDHDPTVGLPLSTDLAAGGSRWVSIEFGPHSAAEAHVTETVDLLYVVAGAITLELDGSVVELGQGDVLVQQGTRHAWRNDHDEPCHVLVHVISSRASASNPPMAEAVSTNATAVPTNECQQGV